MLSQDIYLNNWKPFMVNKIDAENNQFQLKNDSLTFDLKFINKMVILENFINEELEKEINIHLSTLKFNSYIYPKIRNILVKYVDTSKVEEHFKIPKLYLEQEKIFYKYPLDNSKLLLNDIGSVKVKDMLLNEMKQINTNKNYSHFIEASDLFKFKMNLFDGDYKIVLNVEIDPNSYPYSPPIVSWEYPRIPLDKLSQFYGCEIFSKEWNPIVTLEWLIKEFTSQFKEHHFFEYDKQFSKEEQLLSKLFSLNNMFTTDKPLKLNYAPLKKESKDKFWKSGTGYGHSQASTWTIEEYLKESNLINERITKVLQDLKEHLSNLDQNVSEDFKDRFYEFLNYEITSLNLLELEKKIDYYLELFSVILLVDKSKITNLSQFVKDSKDSLSIIPSDKYPSYIHTFLPLIDQFEIKNVKEDIKNKKSKTLNYEDIMKELQFTYYDIKDAKYKYSDKSGKPSSSKQMVRLAQDISALKKSLPLNKESSVWVRWDKNNLTKMQFLISGPKDTPYQDGLFLFDCYFPKEYPSSPPLITIQTTGGGKVRFNPNLYNNGKVCLSLLGTWSGQGGEKWNEKTSTILQILVSIQSLILIEEPYFNEPGYEREIGTAVGKNKSFDYNDNIRKETIRWAILDMIKNPPFGFEDIIKKHFEMKLDDIKETCEKWKDESKKFTKEYEELVKSL